MNKKLDITFHNPNTPQQTREMLLNILKEIYRPKLEIIWNEINNNFSSIASIPKGEALWK